MVSFWKTMFDLGGQKLEQLGLAGGILGAIWLIGLWVFYSWMTGAYLEGFDGAGGMWGITLFIWFLIGAVVYLWQDPHGIRSDGQDAVKMKQTKSD